MPVIEWSQELSIGITSIDEQHKKLITIINSLNTAIAAGEANMMIGDILLELTDYTHYHFSYEEELFEQHGYPETKQHKRQHFDLIEQISGLKERYESELSGSIGLEIIQFLKNWLTHHIMKTDRSYAEYLISRGVK